jgi:hypothetical protein
MHTTTRFPGIPLLIILMLFVSSAAVPAADRSPNILGNIAAVGDVELRGVALSSGGGAFSSTGTVFSGDRIHSGSKAYATVSLSSGTKAELGENTELVIEQSKMDNTTTHIGLVSGNLGFAAAQNPLTVSVANYEVTPKAGSNATVRFYGPDAAGFIVNRGSLTVRDTRSKQSIEFPSGAMYLLNLKGNGPIAQLVSNMPTLPSQPQPLPRAKAGSSTKTALGALGVGAIGGLAIVMEHATRGEKCVSTSCSAQRTTTKTFATDLLTTLSQIKNPTPEIASLQAELKATLAALDNPNLTQEQVDALVAQITRIRFAVVAVTNNASASGG